MKLLCFFICIIFSLPSLAVKPQDKPPSNDEVQNRLDALEFLIKRLSGHTAAVDTWNNSGATTGMPTLSMDIELFYCVPGTLSDECGPGNADITITKQNIQEADQDKIFILNRNNTPGLSEFFAAITDGQNGLLGIESYVYADGLFIGSGGSLRSEKSFFFKSDQPTSDPFFSNDLSGLEIDSLRVAVDRFFVSNGSTETNFSMSGRVIYTLAE